jgi:transposase-like protein
MLSEGVAPNRISCPNCGLPAVAPIGSMHLGKGLVQNDWVCSACGFEWSNRFDGLSV